MWKSLFPWQRCLPTISCQEPSWHGAVTTGSGPRGSSPTGRPKPYHTTDGCDRKYVSRHKHVMRRGFGEDREVRCVSQGRVMATGHRAGSCCWYLSLWTVVRLTRKWAIILPVHGLLRDSWFIYWLSLLIINFFIWPPGSHCLCSNTLMWFLHRPTWFSWGSWQVTQLEMRGLRQQCPGVITSHSAITLA